MIFRHVNDNIYIDDLRLSLERFKELEPEYRDLPVGKVSRIYDVSDSDNKKHFVFDRFQQFHGGDFSEGDIYLSKKDIYAPLVPDEVVNVETLSEAKSRLKNRIDIEAGMARSRLASPGHLIDEEYAVVAEDARNWEAAGRPADAIPLTITDWAEIMNIDSSTAANLILEASTNVKQALRVIRKIRLSAKQGVNMATSRGTVEDLAAGALLQLKAIP